jgi:hypothetical protein
VVAQDGDIPEKELEQETNSLRGRGQAEHVGERWISSTDTRIKPASMPKSRHISPEASTLTQRSALTMYLQHRQGTYYRTRIRLFRYIITKGQSVLEDQFAITTSVPGDNRIR